MLWTPGSTKWRVFLRCARSGELFLHLGATPAQMRAQRAGAAAAMWCCLALVWKIVLVVELLGRPNGVGFQIGIAFQLFDVTRILAYALAFVGVMLSIENLLVQPLERRVSRWRSHAA